MTNIETHAIITANKYVGKLSNEDKVKKLGEEVVELALAIGKNDTVNINEEIGDCLFILLHIASRIHPDKSLGMYIDEAVDKMELRAKNNHYESKK